MGNNGRNFCIVVLILIFIGCVIGYNARKTKYEPLANQAASKLIGSMTYLGELPYSAHEYTLRAIIFCDGINHFVDNNEKFGLMVLSCSYMMAHDVELVPKYDFLNNDVLIQFKKIPME